MQTPESKKRTLAALLDMERWVRAKRTKLHHDIYGPFSFFSQLPLELLYAVLQHVLVDDLRHPSQPSACVALLSTCRRARALLHGWSVHAYGLMGGIPLEPAIELRFYLLALGRVQQGRAVEAGCKGGAVAVKCTPTGEVPDLQLLAYAGHYKAIQWVLSVVGNLDPLLALVRSGRYMWTVVHNLVPPAQRDVVQFVQCVEGHARDQRVYPILREAIGRAFHQRGAWMEAVKRAGGNTHFMAAVLPLYGDGWLAEWGDLFYNFGCEAVCAAAHSRFRLAFVPASADDPVNPVVRDNALVAVTSPHWEELNLRGVVCTPRPHHLCDQCFRVDLVERVRRAHKRGAVVVPNKALLTDLGSMERLMEVADLLYWRPTLGVLWQISKMPGRRCAGMQRIAVLSGGCGEWREFVGALPANPLRRRIMAVLPQFQ